MPASILSSSVTQSSVSPPNDPESPGDTAQLGYLGEIYRKLLHLLAMAFPVGYVIVPDPWGLAILVVLSVTALSLDMLRARNKAAHSFFERFFGFMMRRKERDVLGQVPVFNGATWVTVSFTLLILLFPSEVAIVSFTLFMFGDAAAALLGRRFGRTPWLRRGATLEGSMAFFAISGVTGWLLVSGNLPWDASSISHSAVFGAALVATFLEAAPLPIDDNLVAPMGAAIAMAGIMGLGL